MNALRQWCLDLRTKDHTLAEICKITGEKKTTVYYYIREMPLSAHRKQAIRKVQGVHIRRFALARKGKSARSFQKFQSWDEKNVSLLAHLMFDGEIIRGRCAYHNRNQILIEKVARHMRRLYSFAPSRYYNKHTGVFRVSYFNVALAGYLQEKAALLLQDIYTLPVEMKREFVRAFFNDEGCAYMRGVKKRLVRGYQKDKTILKVIQILLLDFGIASRIVLPNEVVISGKNNLVRFQKEINFSKGVRINGNRSNSIWKESLEKREILRRAIRSFKT